MTPAEAVDLLGKIKFFAGLPAAYLRRIADIGTEEEHKGATTVFQEGDKGDKFYLIIDGAVRISRMVPGMGEEALAILDPGAAFGEMAVVEEGLRSADALAHEGEAVLLRIGRDPLDQLLFTDKELAYSVLWALVRTLSARLRDTNEKMKALFAMSKF